MHKILKTAFKIITMILAGGLASILVLVIGLVVLFYIVFGVVLHEDIPKDTARLLQESAEQHLEQTIGEDFIPTGIGWGYLKADYSVGLRLARNHDVLVGVVLTEHNGEIDIDYTTVLSAYLQVISSDAASYFKPLADQAFKKKYEISVLPIIPIQPSESHEVWPSYEEIKTQSLKHSVTIYRYATPSTNKQMEDESRKIFNFINLARNKGLLIEPFRVVIRKKRGVDKMIYIEEPELSNIHSSDEILNFFLK